MSRHMVIISDSIPQGFNTGNPGQLSQWSAIEQLRTMFPGTVQVEGFGGATLNQDASSTALATALAQKIGSNGITPTDVVIQRGTNDWNTGLSATTFNTAYTNAVTALLAAYPNANIACLDPTLCFTGSAPDESTANASGNFLRDFRTQIKKVVATTNKPNVTHVYASAWVPRQHLGDGLHPDQVGNNLWARGLLGSPAFNLLPALPIQTTPLGLAAGAPVAYFEGDNLTIGALGTLASWPDLTGNGHGYAQATGANKPGVALDATINFNVMQSDNARWMQAPNFTLNQPCMRVLVVNPSALGASGSHDVLCDGGSGAFNFILASDTTPETLMGSNGQTLTAATALTTSSWNILLGIWNGTAWTLVAEFGPLTGSSAVIPTRVTGTKTTGNPGGLTIGALSNGARGVAGSYYADYPFSYANESTGNELVEGYIKPKLGL